MKRCPTCKRPFPETPGERLRALREALSLSQPELAERLGVSRATIARAEAGSRPRPALMRKLAGLEALTFA